MQPLFKKALAIVSGVIVIGVLIGGGYFYSKKTKTASVVSGIKTFTFEKFGFSVDLPLDKMPTCNPLRERTKEEAYAKNERKEGYDLFCNTVIDKITPSIHVGWKDASVDNTTFVKNIAKDFTLLVAGPNKQFSFTCDNKTGIATSIAPPFPSRAFTCFVSIEKVTYTMSFFMFNTQKHPGTNNFLMMMDLDALGSFKNQMMIDLGKTVKIVTDGKPVSVFLFETVYADPDDGGPAGDSGGGEVGGGAGQSPNLTDSSGVQVGSGTSGLGWGTGCSSCSSGGGEGTTGTGSGTGSGGAVNGACSTTRYTCSAGILGGTAEYPDAVVTNWYAYQWWCNGTGGGANILCTEYKPNPTGTLNATPAACQIATGAASCPTTLTWTTTNPQGTSGITRDGTPGLLFSGNNDSKATNVPYEADGSVTYRLYNNAVELGSATVAVSCTSGKYDTDGAKCADPRVESAVVDGEYYPPGTITLTCSNSESYSVFLDGAVFVATTTYTVPVTISNISQEGNYVIRCIQGSVVDQVTRFYDATPPAATIQLEASPVTIGKDGKVTLSWKTKYPSNTCTLTAKAVCPNGACSSAQSSFESSVNAKLQSEKTDANDPAGSRLISTAVTKVAPGHLGSDWLALGRKTLQISFTTDLIYDCGAGNKATKRIQVTKSELQ